MPSSFLTKIKQAELNTPPAPPVYSQTPASQPVLLPSPAPPVPALLPSPAPPAYHQTPSPQPDNYNLVYNKLLYAVQNNNLQRFYSHDRLTHLARTLSAVPLQSLADDFKISAEVAADIYQLALYDVILLADDSGSMALDGRIDELHVVTEKIVSVATRFDQDGIAICFLNDSRVREVKSVTEVSDIIRSTRFSGSTPIGCGLKNKIVAPFVVSKANSGQLHKPVLVIVITDGAPDSKDDVYSAIKEAKDFNEKMGTNCVEFEFAQIGSDKAAQKFLSELDVHPVVGDIVDVTSSYELEEEEFANAGATLTPYMWIVKLMLGAIDPCYDAKDEPSKS
jgi:Mg-chelatase subunit ChlD